MYRTHIERRDGKTFEIKLQIVGKCTLFSVELFIKLCVQEDTHGDYKQGLQA